MSEALQEYFSKVGKYPLLSREEEVTLAKKIEAGDPRAKNKMIESNLRLAISIAKKYQQKGCSLEDLIQESNMGLMKAVERFDWRKGFKFSTYAYWWIKQSVRTHIASQASDIKLPAHTRNLLYKMNQLIREYEDEFDQKPALEDVAAMLGVPMKTLLSLIKCSNQLSLDKNIKDKSGGAGRKISEIIPDSNAINIDDLLDSIKIKKVMSEALQSLTSREENIIRLRFGINDFPESEKSNFIMSREEIRKARSKSK